MRIDPAKCIGCGRCHPSCTMGAILYARYGRSGRLISAVDEDECVDCGVCERSRVCPAGALFQPVHPWPRSIRGTFSNPLAEHKETRVPGRGTAEMKTNDITGRYRYGYTGVNIELGRPGTGARLRDLEKVTTALAGLGIEFEAANPVTSLLADPRTGRVKPEALDEKVLSLIVELSVENPRVPELVRLIEGVARGLETVCSLDVISRAGPDGSAPSEELFPAIGQPLSRNGKTNLGLGRATNPAGTGGAAT